MSVCKHSFRSSSISPKDKLDKLEPLRFSSWFPTLISCSLNLPRVYIRLCKHGNHFTFLHYYRQISEFKLFLQIETEKDPHAHYTLPSGMLFGCIYVCTACFHTCKRVKLRRLKIHLLKGMKSSAEIEIEDILRSSDSLLEKNLKVFVLLLFSSNSLEKKGISRKTRQKLWANIFKSVHRFFSDPFVPTHPCRRKGSVLRRLLTLFRSYLPQKRSNLGV